MSFRDNLQHLRATRNMTQEQLAMLLGVSRQSVSKWEAERAYPEMDKLLKLCDLFDCTLDELVLGDLTARPTDAASSMPSGKVMQDVTGYDHVMSTSASRIALGASIPILGLSLAFLLSGFDLVPGFDPWNLAGILVFIGAAVGLALVIPALFERSGFRKAHPFVEDFYTADQKKQARSILSTGLVIGIGLALLGLASVMVFEAMDWLASAIFCAFFAGATFLIIRAVLLGSRCNLEAYNQKSLYGMNESQIDALDNEELQTRARQTKRKNSIYSFVMLLATAVGLILLFVPELNAQRWFWLAWAIGGILCGAISAFLSMRENN